MGLCGVVFVLRLTNLGRTLKGFSTKKSGWNLCCYCCCLLLYYLFYLLSNGMLINVNFKSLFLFTFIY